MSKSVSYREARQELKSPLEVKLNDCLQRNSDHIHTIELTDDAVVVSTRWETVALPLDKPVHVWRQVKD